MKKRNITLIALAAALVGMALLAKAQTAPKPPATPQTAHPGFNTSDGQRALFALTSGIWNSAFGAFALASNTDGSYNTAVGTGAMLLNVGNQSTGEGLQNTALGAVALFSNTTGSYNTASGSNALFGNTVGKYNTANGCYALSVNSSGLHNTATGFSALANSNGSDNTASGSHALGENFDGIQNTATGSQALLHNNGGNFNTAVGYQALLSNDTGSTNTAVGVGTLAGTTSGGANTAIGYGAGANVTTGTFNVYIGANVGGVADEVGHTYISNITSTQQNLSPVTVDLATGLLGHEFSSQRYKEDIKPMESASAALFALRPVTYRYKKEIDKAQPLDYGLVAEEVAKVSPNLAVRDGKGRIESVRYNAINAMLLNEFLKEHRKVQKLEETVATQEKGIQILHAQLKEQAAQIKKVSSQIQTNRLTTTVALNNP
jgi:uncharacterized coiled-coil protein SlyX